MGVVYKAFCDDEVAAVKVVRPGLLDDPQVVARFEREAQVLRSVDDQHISRFLDEDIQGVPAWLATQWARPRADGRWELLGDPAHRRINPIPPVSINVNGRPCHSTSAVTRSRVTPG